MYLTCVLHLGQLRDLSRGIQPYGYGHNHWHPR
jgi:hypothetical protein